MKFLCASRVKLNPNYKLIESNSVRVSAWTGRKFRFWDLSLRRETFSILLTCVCSLEWLKSSPMSIECEGVQVRLIENTVDDINLLADWK